MKTNQLKCRFFSFLKCFFFISLVLFSSLYVFTSCDSAAGSAPAALLRIEADSSEMKTVYRKGEAFDTTGLKIYGFYSTGKISLVAGWELTSPDGYIFTEKDIADSEDNPFKVTVFYSGFVCYVPIKFNAIEPDDAENYSVTYVLPEDAVNSSLNPNAYRVTDETIELKSPSRKHYEFDGWFTTEDCEEGSEISQIEKGSYGALKLYSKWSPVLYSLTFHPGEGRIPDVEEAGVYKLSYDVSSTILLPVPVLEHYNFIGWYLTERKPTVEDKDVSGGEQASDIDELSENEKNTEEGQSSSRSISDGASSTSDLSNDGEGVLLDPLTEFSSVYGNFDLWAKWEVETHSIEYNLNGGAAGTLDEAENSPENPSSYAYDSENIQLEEPVRPGYKFEGWFTTAGFDPESEIEFIPSHSETDFVLYAKWSLVTYKITYGLSGGENSLENKETYTVDDFNFTLSEPTFTTHEFEGWYETSDFSGEPITEIDVSRLEDITLFAKWDIESYAVTYNLNGGADDSDGAFGKAENDPLNPLSFTLESPDLELYPAKRNGYEFSGWYASSDFSGSSVKKIPAGSEEPVELWAKWTLETYTLSYSLNGGKAPSSNPSTYTVEDLTLKIKAPSKKSCDFDGWYFDKDFTKLATTEKIVTSGVRTDIVSLKKNLSSASSLGKITLYAKWIQPIAVPKFNLARSVSAIQTPLKSVVAEKIEAAGGEATNGYANNGDGTGVASAIGATGNASSDDATYAPSINVRAPSYTEIPGLSSPEVSENTITFTAPEAYSSYAWYVDKADEPLSTSKTFVINLENTELSAGSHSITLKVLTSYGLEHSAQYEFSFVK